MKLFSFRLDSVLNYRKHLEKKSQKDVVNARNACIRKGVEVRRLGEKRMESGRKCRDEVSKGMDGALYHMHRSFLQKLDQDLQEAYMNLKATEDTVKDRERVLKEESIKKRTLEKLKDLQVNKYLRRIGREEQKHMDELAILTRRGKV